MEESSMSNEYPKLDDVLADQFEEIARAEEVQDMVQGGQHTTLMLSEAQRSARREALWGELSTNYPQLVDSRQAPSLPVQHAQIERRDFDTGRISFSNGVPVGGSGHLALFSDGTYSFNGHFHVSGAPSYNYGLVLVVADVHNRPITFAHTGRLHGTFESGSRDDNFAGTANNAMISQLWNSGLGTSWYWRANTNINVLAAINSVIQAAGYVAAVAAIVV
jgi:hypothetical protein